MKKNWFIAISIFGIFFLWMISGCFKTSSQKLAKEEAKTPILRVQTQILKAEYIQKEVIVSAKTEAARRVKIKSELEARVISIGAKKGSFVKKGDLIVNLDPRNLAQRLSEAKALQTQRELEFAAAQDLYEKNFQAETKVAEAKALLEQARSNVEAISINLEHTAIKAPFSGKLDNRFVEIGDFVSVGNLVAEVIEVNPFIVSGKVTERDIHDLQLGGKGFATLVSGETFEGTISYIAPSADLESRTFTVELEVEHNNRSIPIGETATLLLPTQKVLAHTISPAHLSLNDEGLLGVKVVGEDNQVIFYPAQLIKASMKAVALAGMPETIELITIGQGFASIGEQVTPVPEENPATDTSI